MELLRSSPTQFDGGDKIEPLPVGHTYTIYAEPLNGAVGPSQITNAMQPLCRNNATDSGWPSQFSCVVPTANTEFTVRANPGLEPTPPRKSPGSLDVNAITARMQPSARKQQSRAKGRNENWLAR
jgi:hypothetical protein